MAAHKLTHLLTVALGLVEGLEDKRRSCRDHRHRRLANAQKTNHATTKLTRRARAPTRDAVLAEAGRTGGVESGQSVQATPALGGIHPHYGV